MKKETKAAMSAIKLDKNTVYRMCRDLSENALAEGRKKLSFAPVFEDMNPEKLKPEIHQNKAYLKLRDAAVRQATNKLKPEWRRLWSKSLKSSDQTAIPMGWVGHSVVLTYTEQDMRVGTYIKIRDVRVPQISWYEPQLESGNLPEGKDRDVIVAALKELNDMLTKVADLNDTFVTLFGPCAVSYRRGSRPAEARNLYQLYTLWPDMAHEYCRRAKIALPTDSNSEGIVEQQKASLPALRTAAAVDATAIMELAKRLNLPYSNCVKEVESETTE